jgi:hypothetical protein
MVHLNGACNDYELGLVSPLGSQYWIFYLHASDYFLKIKKISKHVVALIFFKLKKIIKVSVCVCIIIKSTKFK